MEISPETLPNEFSLLLVYAGVKFLHNFLMIFKQVAVSFAEE